MKKAVLLADDEEGILALVAATVSEDERYRVLLAHDGEEALRVAQKELPDVLFMDVLMPKRDGYEVCRALKDGPSTRHIKVVLLTALAQELDRKKGMDAGADSYLTKPFSPLSLMRKLEEMLK